MTHLSCIVHISRTPFEDASSSSSSAACMILLRCPHHSCIVYISHITWLICRVLYIHNSSHDSFVVYCVHAFWGCLLLILLHILHQHCIVYISHITWLICRVLYIYHTRILRMPPPYPPPLPASPLYCIYSIYHMTHLSCIIHTWHITWHTHLHVCIV